VQAADYMAREALDHRTINGLTPVSMHVDEQGVDVVFRDPDVTVRLAEREVRLGTPATCRAMREGTGFEYDLLNVRIGQA
jgi:hypothetical protein